jgi:tetratricopeptide (TPR) repeat protein
MQFDTNNNVVRLCAEGMELEGQGRNEEALQLFQQAWRTSSDNFEKFTSAHYVARHQESIENKLQWDKTALEFALKIGDESISGALPSLYLNIAKCYEDLNDFGNARSNYKLAFCYGDRLPDNGYGRMIKEGIIGGFKRVKEKQ